MIFVVGVVIMRANGCIINDFADRNLDAHVKAHQYRRWYRAEVSVKGAFYRLICIWVLVAFSLVLLLRSIGRAVICGRGLC